MFSFIDENGFKVDLSFGKGPFPVEPRHVLVLVQHEGKWLCAIHHTRGFEFPGGKMEEGETLEEAAIREVYEETAVQVTDVQWLAYYVVHEKIPFCKAVFTAKVKQIDEFLGEHETLGVVWLTPDEFENHPNLSFHMNDAGMKKILQEVKKLENRW